MQRQFQWEWTAFILNIDLEGFEARRRAVSGSRPGTQWSQVRIPQDCLHATALPTVLDYHLTNPFNLFLELKKTANQTTMIGFFGVQRKYIKTQTLLKFQ